MQAFIVHATQPIGCVRALGEGEAGEHTEGNARGARPYARLRWQEPWGTAERARCPRPTAKVPNGY